MATSNLSIYFTAFGVFISLVSLALAISAKRESRELSLLELAHQKRMLLSNRFAEVAHVISSLREHTFEDPEEKKSYQIILKLRNHMIDEMNKSSELLLEPKKLNRKQLLNEISDYSLRLAIHQTDIIFLQEIIERKKTKLKSGV